MSVVLAVVIALATVWLFMVVVMIAARPRGLQAPDIVRVLPETLGLLRRLAADRSVPRAPRVMLSLLLVYLLFPIDLVPDIVPVVGHADDVIVTALALRFVVRRSGPDVIRRHWRGSDAGLAAVLRLAGAA